MQTTTHERIEKIRAARDEIARRIHDQGDEWLLPFFIRCRDELAKLEAQQDVLFEIAAIASAARERAA